MYRKFLCLLTVSILLPSWSLAFDNKSTHPRLTEEAIANTNVLKKTLEEELSLQENIKTKLSNNRETFSITEWLKKGSLEEDNPVCRSSNHFHNPLKPWTEAGLTDSIWSVDLWCDATSPYNDKYSNLVWATGIVNTDGDTLDPPVNDNLEVDNGRSWSVAREMFHSALFGESLEIREFYMAETFRTLGYVLHLLQDMAVPAHTRNDFSQGHTQNIGCPEEGGCLPLSWIGNPFEGYVRNNFDKIDAAITNISTPFTGEKTLSNFWDTDTADSPQIGFGIGLAEYSSANFVSYGTVFKQADTDEDHYFPYPNRDSIADQEDPDSVDQYLERNILAKDNELDTVIFIRKNKDGQVVDKFLTPRYIPVADGRDWSSEELFDLALTINDECYKQYATYLVPRAIGYSASLLDYFFRGKMEVDAVPLILGEYVHGVIFFIKNMTEIGDSGVGEDMGEGSLALVVENNLVDGTDQDGNLLDMRAEKAIDGLDFGEESVLSLFFENPILISSLSTLNDTFYHLSFTGELGDELDAVVGKISSLGGYLLFNEEWYGLGGNYDWTHSDAEEEDIVEPDIIKNYIVDDALVKENIQIEGSDDQYNETHFDLTTDVNYPGGILVSPHTYIEYKVDEMYIINKPVAPEGYTYDYQVIWLLFSDGLRLQLSHDSFVLGSDATAYWSFEPGNIMIDNIFETFEYWKIPIPDNLYLEKIVLSQRLYQPENEISEQHMKVDFFRIIEGQPEEEDVTL